MWKNSESPAKDRRGGELRAGGDPLARDPVVPKGRARAWDPAALIGADGSSRELSQRWRCADVVDWDAVALADRLEAVGILRSMPAMAAVGLLMAGLGWAGAWWAGQAAPIQFVWGSMGLMAGYLGPLAVAAWGKESAQACLEMNAARWLTAAHARGLADSDPLSEKRDKGAALAKLASAALGMSGEDSELAGSIEAALTWRMGWMSSQGVAWERACQAGGSRAAMALAAMAARLAGRGAPAAKPSAGKGLSPGQAEALWRGAFPGDAAAWERQELRMASNRGGHGKRSARL